MRPILSGDRAFVAAMGQSDLVVVCTAAHDSEVLGLTLTNSNFFMSPHSAKRIQMLRNSDLSCATQGWLE